MPRLIVEAVSAPDGSSSGIGVGVPVSDEAGNPVNGLSAAKFVLAGASTHRGRLRASN
jgi:hypothetical protein